MTSGFSLLDLALSSAPEVFIVDIGAAPTERARYRGLVERGAARVLGFEPDAAQRAEAAKAYPRDTYLAHVLGDGGEHVFHRCHYPGCSSLFAPDAALINSFSGISADPEGNFAVEGTERVATVRLDDVAEAAGCDLLTIDVQGAELMVLENAPSLLETALVIESEVEFVPLYEDQPLFADVDAFLRSRGFLLHKLADASGRSFRPLVWGDDAGRPMSQLLWADAVFVRDFRTLEGASDGDLMKLALILNDVYGSVDLCARVLQILGARLAQPLDKLYLKSVEAAGAARPTLVSVKEDSD